MTSFSIYKPHGKGWIPFTSGMVLAGIFFSASQAQYAHANKHTPAPAPMMAAQANSNAPENSIVAVVNGVILTKRDVDNREKLFAVSTGLPLTPDTMARLRPHIIDQLIDEKLRTQAILGRQINIEPEQIAAAISDIEKRNGLPERALRDKLAQDGISLTTLIDQLRVQLGWNLVLQQEMGSRAHITAHEITRRQEALKKEEGRPLYLVSEIFIPVNDPRHTDNEYKFAQTIIQQLKAGAPFPIVAAQFSQSQSALEGGSLGWVQEDNLDPAVVSIVRQMPIGAISNPIRVAGGFMIATLIAKKTIGHDMGTVMNVRQLFLPFSSPLDPQHVTPQQNETLQKALAYQKTLHSCEEVEAANKQAGEKRPSNPGEIIMERVNPNMGAILQNLPPLKLSQPLVSREGIDLIMVCSKERKNFANQSATEIANQLLNERAEQASRQLNRELHRQAVIDMRVKH